MAQRLKRWESPRREGRNSKGKGGSARQRQIKKRTQALRRKLQDSQFNQQDNQKPNREENANPLPCFLFGFRFFRWEWPIVPNLDQPICPARCQGLPIRAEGHRLDPVGLCWERADQFTRC